MFPDLVEVSYPLLLLLAPTNRAPVSTMDGLPGGCNPADVLFKLAHGRGIKAPIFEQIGEQGPPHAKTFAWSCSFFEVMFMDGDNLNISFILCSESIHQCWSRKEQERGKKRGRKESNIAARSLYSPCKASETRPFKEAES